MSGLSGLSGPGGPTGGAGPAGSERPWVGAFWAGIWLVFLESAAVAGWRLLPGWRGVLGLLLLGTFAALYVFMFAHRRSELVRWRESADPARRRVGVVVLAALALLAAAETAVVGQEGMATLVFVGVAGVVWLPRRFALVAVGVLAAASLVLPGVVSGWSRETSLTLSILLAAFAMLGVLTVIARNQALALAWKQNAELAVDEERNRFARDLHDILGHSLTVITVKAELARRLVDVDTARAAVELEGLERLSRDALADVRRAVEGYREITLPGELARARSALASAQIEATLPTATEMVTGDLRELFAWTIREGVTNVIRHSGATHCRIQLDETSVKVLDDGPGGTGDEALGGEPGRRPGNGLSGLHERARQAGAVLVCTAGVEGGFTLEVSV